MRSGGNAHINSDLQVLVSNGNTIEVGAWDGPHEYCNFTCSQPCYYGAHTFNGGYADTCAVSFTSTPKGPNRFRLEYVGGTAWRAFVDVTTIFTGGDKSATSSLTLAGSEEGANSLPSNNVGPKIHWTSLSYSPANGTTIQYRPWGGFSACFVNYRYYEGFIPGPFASSFYSAVSAIGGPPPTCNGSAPTSQRTAWQ